MVSDTEFGTVRQSQWLSVGRPKPAHEALSIADTSSQVIEVIAGRFLFAFVRDVALFAASQGVQDAVCYSIDAELVSTTR